VNHFRHRFAGAAIIVALLSGCAAYELHRDGLAAIDRGDYENGVAKLVEAVHQDPQNMGYRLDLTVRRDQAVQALVATADSARAAGELDAAAPLYRRALAIDPLNNRALRGLEGLDADRRHAAVVAEARKDFDRKDFDAADAKLRTVLDEDPGYTAAQKLASEINGARGPVTVAPKLKTRDNRKVTLQLRDAPTKMVFEVLSRETGINFIIDKDVKSDTKTTIFVQDVPVEQAIDLVLDQNALSRQILAANMVLIYPNTAAKQKDYEEEMVRTFYITNAAPKDVESLLKTVLGTKTLFIDERAGVVVMRDTPDAVRMAEKLVASLDVAEPEVMLEVEVLEISRSRLQDLGIQYPSTATLTPTPQGFATGGASGLVLEDLNHQNSRTIQITPLSVTLNALKQSGLINTLASPRIRARNKEKAKILIGQREPVITNSVTPTAAGTPVVTGSVQYLDVGLTLEVQPQIYLDSDVAIKINLEVSSILKQVTTASGTIAYEIGTRNANTLLRLKDGETQILAGLIQDSDTHTANSIPGLGDIPGVGRVFGTHHTDAEKDEIVLSITPRIIRMQRRPASDSTEFWYGTETRTRSQPLGLSIPSEPAAPPAPGPRTGPAISDSPSSSTPLPITTVVPPPPTSSVTPAPPPGPAITAPPAPIVASNAAAPAAQTEAGSEAAATATPASATSAAAAPATPSKAPATTAPAKSAATLDGPSSARVGEEFQVAVHLSTDQEITRLRSQVRFDAGALQLVSATPGDMVPSAAGSPTVNTRPGGAQLEIITTPDDPVKGEGSVMVLHFKAMRPAASTNVAAMLSVMGAAGAAVGNSSAQPLAIAIQP
jgi:general secretion pathway protein D